MGLFLHMKMLINLKKIIWAQAIEFSQRFQALVEKYNELNEDNVLVINVLEDFSDEIITLYQELKVEINSFVDMGIDLEEKSFYDILKALAKKYDLSYPEEKLLELTMGEILIIKTLLMGLYQYAKGTYHDNEAGKAWWE